MHITIMVSCLIAAIYHRDYAHINNYDVVILLHQRAICLKHEIVNFEMPRVSFN